MTYRADDINLLLPAFIPKVRQVLAALVTQNHDPVPFDTLRTPAEAAKLFARGTGSKNSMHLYGIACDVICNKHGWNCGKFGCRFYQDLGASVRAAGLEWGGTWKTRVDLPHFQGCSVADQPTVRRLPWDERNAFVAARMCR